ncbi:hypothetical protein Bbelb_349510 [Branchiostoma belcheri]|nr:hypothetical protein Bbelb_349510 [Branchiostoma belcheri]
MEGRETRVVHWIAGDNRGDAKVEALWWISAGSKDGHGWWQLKIKPAYSTAQGDMQHNGNLLSSEDIPAILQEHLAHTNPRPISTAARSSDDPPTSTTATSSAPTTTNTATATSSAPTTTNTATATSSAPPTNTTATPTSSAPPTNTTATPTSSAPPTNTTATPTADCERAFSTLKRVKTRLRSRLKTSTLNNLLKISIDGPHIDDFNFEEAATVWGDAKPQDPCVDSLKRQT